MSCNFQASEALAEQLSIFYCSFFKAQFHTPLLIEAVDTCRPFQETQQDEDCACLRPAVVSGGRQGKGMYGDVVKNVKEVQNVQRI